MGRARARGTLACAAGLLLLLAAGGAHADDPDVATLEAADFDAFADRECQRPAARLLLEGADLDAEAAQALEARLGEDPDDLAARLRLVSYRYARVRNGTTPREAAVAALMDLLVGLVERHPRSRLAGTFAGMWLGAFRRDGAQEEGTRDRLRAAWLAQIEAHPEDAAILGNAGVFLIGDLFQPDDMTRGRQLLERAREIAAEEARWAEALGRLLSMMLEFGPPNPDEARAALRHLQDAHRLLTAAGSGARADVLREPMVRAALEGGDAAAARMHATAVLEGIRDENDAGRRAPWQIANTVHQMEILLGRAALQEGDLDAAGRHLLAAGEVEGSPQLKSFGPDLRLAATLLEAGRLETVRDYLKACAAFWKSGKQRLERWLAALERGTAPDLGVEPYDQAPPAPPALVGHWESEARSMGGISSAMVLAADGTYVQGMVVRMDFTWELEGDQLTLTAIDTNAADEVSTVVIDGDRLTKTWKVKEDEITMEFVRVGKAAPDVPSPLIGVWKPAVPSAMGIQQRYDADGTAYARIPMPGWRGGRWDAEGERVRLIPAPGPGGRGGAKDASILTWQIADAILTLTSEEDGKPWRGRRVEPAGWYR